MIVQDKLYPRCLTGKYNEKCKYNPASLDRNDTVSIMRRNKRNINNNRERFLTREEAASFRPFGKRSYRTYLMALIALLTGARAGEILSIQFKDIDYTHTASSHCQKLKMELVEK